MVRHHRHSQVHEAGNRQPLAKQSLHVISPSETYERGPDAASSTTKPDGTRADKVQYPTRNQQSGCVAALRPDGSLQNFFSKGHAAAKPVTAVTRPILPQSKLHWEF